MGSDISPASTPNSSAQSAHPWPTPHHFDMPLFKFWGLCNEVVRVMAEIASVSGRQFLPLV